MSLLRLLLCLFIKLYVLKKSYFVYVMSVMIAIRNRHSAISLQNCHQRQLDLHGRKKIFSSSEKSLASNLQFQFQNL